jgi:hypothetical protein
LKPETKAKWAALGPDLRDLIVFSGIAAASYGAWLVYQPAGFVIGGGLMFYLGVWGAR